MIHAASADGYTSPASNATRLRGNEVAPFIQPPHAADALLAQSQELWKASPSKSCATASITPQWAHTTQIFHEALQNGDALAVRHILAALPRAKRFTLVNQPLTNDAGTFTPNHPLGLSASMGRGDIAELLLAPPGACPDQGDKGDGHVYTALFWGAYMGHLEIMDLLHDAWGLPRSQVLLACQAHALPLVVDWLRKHEVHRDKLDPAMRAAVTNNDIESLHNLIEHGGGNPNCQMPHSSQSLLDHAIEQRFVEVVEVLLAAGATASSAHLRAAIACGDKAMSLYGALCRAGVEPRNAGEVANLRPLAQSHGDAGLLYLLAVQRKIIDRRQALEQHKQTAHRDVLLHNLLAQRTALCEPVEEDSTSLGNAPLAANLAVLSGEDDLSDIAAEPPPPQRKQRLTKRLLQGLGKPSGHKDAGPSGALVAIDVAR